MAEAVDNQLQLIYNLPWFIEDPAEALNRYKTPNCFVVLDLETNNKNFGSALTPTNHIVLACWDVVYSDGTVESKHAWGDEYEMAELEADINQADFVVAHNAKFELQWLKRCGMELRDILAFDTYLAEWVIAGNRGGQKGWELNLDDTAARYGLPAKISIVKHLIDMGADPADIPQHLLLPYCYRDVELARKLFYKQLAILVRDGLLHLALSRNLACAALADLEFNGGELDTDVVHKEYEETLKEFRELDATLDKFTGGINLSSPTQLGKYLFDTLKFPIPLDHKKQPLVTKKGAPKTDVKTLEKLRADTGEQREFLRLYKRRNKLDSLLSKNLEFFRLVCEQKAGKFYGNINQGFTQTHRFNATGRAIIFEGLKKPKGIQFQNMPRGYKKLFAAHHPDYVDVECDGAQLEFRVGVEMGQDEAGIKMICNGEDVHADTAKVFVDWNAEKPNKHPEFIGLSYKEARQPAKPFTFMPMYGGNGKHPAENEYAQFFRAKYNGIAGMQKEWCLEVLDSGKLRTPYGLIMYWPGTRMSRSGYIDNTTNISNYPIQGFATAEIIPIALVYCWQRSRNYRVVVWNTIHDSIAARVHKDDVDIYKQISKISFTHDVYKFLRDVYNYEFTLPLGVGIKVGDHWGVAPFEENWDVYPTGETVYKRK